MDQASITEAEENETDNLKDQLPKIETFNTPVIIWNELLKDRIKLPPRRRKEPPEEMSVSETDEIRENSPNETPVEKTDNYTDFPKYRTYIFP